MIGILPIIRWSFIPLDIALVQNLNYGKVLCAGEEDLFMALHEAPWNQSASITPNFTLHKMKGDCNQAELPNRNRPCIF